MNVDITIPYWVVPSLLVRLDGKELGRCVCQLYCMYGNNYHYIFTIYKSTSIYIYTHTYICSKYTHICFFCFPPPVVMSIGQKRPCFQA